MDALSQKTEKAIKLYENLTKNVTMSDLYRPGEALIKSLMRQETEPLIPGAPTIQTRGPRRII